MVADCLQNYPVDFLFSSPYLRARQTVQPLAERLGLTVQIESDLRERLLGEAPQGIFQEIVKRTWQEMDFAYPGGESNRSAQARGQTVILRLRIDYPAAHIVIGTHGNLLALALNAFQPSIGFEFWDALTMPDLYRLKFSPVGQVEIDRCWQTGAS